MSTEANRRNPYRGRLAPTPTGYLHLGHARTFWVAWKRAREKNRGHLTLRIEDIDLPRCKEEFTAAALEDLTWLGLDWDSGPNQEGPQTPFHQSRRHARGDYLGAWRRLKESGVIYPCRRSRKDIARATLAPHAEDERAEPIFPREWRPPVGTGGDATSPGDTNWRFRVPDGERVQFDDQCAGPQSFRAGTDFGDFLVWRRDGMPSYELAVVTDDLAMQITEVVRGEDLLLSTARQGLLYQALGGLPPEFFHCPLMTDSQGRRLAKRDQAKSLRSLRENGRQPDDLRRQFRRRIQNGCPVEGSQKILRCLRSSGSRK